jgi:hypothetical protein
MSRGRRESATTLAELGLGAWLERGEFVHILTDWSDEIYPLYAYHPSRHLPPAKSGHSWISSRRLAQVSGETMESASPPACHRTNCYMWFCPGSPGT